MNLANPYPTARPLSVAATRMRAILAAGLMLSGPFMQGAAFTAGNLVVVRVGTGSGSLIAAGNPVFLDEYTTGGSLVQSIALPTAASGANRAFFQSGTATSEGALSRSANGQYLVLAGYASSDGTTSLPGTTGSAVNRVVARVDASGTIDTTTALSDFASGGNPRSATSSDGSAFWVAGSVGGVRYTAIGGTTSTQLSTTVTNLRVAQIFGGQLYVSDSSGTAVRLGAVGSGLPTTSGQTIVNLAGFPTSGSPYGYFFADLDNGTPGLDTVYVADDTANQIQKFCLVSGTWVARGTITASGARGLTASVSGSSVTLYGTTGASAAAGGGTLYQFTDTTGYNATVSGTATSLATAAANTAFRGIAFAPATITTTPAVSATTPANGALGVATSSNIAISFNEPVTVTGAWFTIAGGTSGTHAAAVTGGPTNYTLIPTTSFADGETVSVTVLASQIVDAATTTTHPSGDYSFSFRIAAAPLALAIHTIQGSGTASPYVGQLVTTQGIVTASFQGSNGLGGFYLQAAEADYDSDPATSEGIFVFNNSFLVTPGDVVSVTGTVAEFGTPTTETEISSVTNVQKVGTAALPAPTLVTLPFAGPTDGERYEGMRVTLPQTLTVTDNFDLGHFGEFILSLGRLETPTNVVAPGAPAQTLEIANFLSQILVDDGSSANYPDPTPDLADSAGRGLTRRTGSTVTGLAGILDEKFGSYIIEPTEPPVFVDANPRGDPPAASGTLRVCMGNVQNLMNGNGSGLDGSAGGFPTSRGASNLTEYQRQLVKVTAAILNLAPDIMGLTEVENDKVTNSSPDSYGPTSAIAQLVGSLNANAPAGTTYAYVNALGVDITTDQIHVALIYRVESVQTVGTPAMLSNPAFNDVARNPLAQTFIQIASGQKLTVCINHFRAKGSAAAGASNADSGDGQGTNNALRVQEANALTAWLATDPTGSGDPDFLIVGDLNSYTKEDPVTAILNAGYVNVIEKFEGAGGYSYAFNGEFGHLDHALANPHLAEQIASAATWHVNSDELVYYDYNTENKDAAQQAINTGTVYRYADHDPVVISLGLHPEYAAPVFTLQPQSQTVTAFDSVTFTAAASGYPAPLYQWQRNNSDIGGATATTLTLNHVTTAAAGTYTAVAINPIGSATSNPAVLIVNKAAATVTLGNLTFIYDGTPKPATATTSPAGLTVKFTYNGSTTTPVNVGSYAVVATIDDPNYQGSASGTLVISDGTPPVIRSLVASPAVLQPVNHKMIPVVIAADVVDDVDPAPITHIISVSSNQLINGTGDGNTSPDWSITGALTLNLRAERSGDGGDRIYTITVESRDHSNNASTKTVTVTVPHSN